MSLNRSPSTALPLMSGLASAGHSLGGVPLQLGGLPAKLKITTVTILRPPVKTEILTPDSLLHAISPDLLAAKPRLTAPRAARPTSKRLNVGVDVLPYGYVPPVCTDAALHDALQTQAATLLGVSGLNDSVQKVWQATLDGLKKGAAAGAAVATLDIALTQLGFHVIADLLIDLVNLIVGAISQALVVSGTTTLATATVAGGTFGYVGAAIGAVIGACIAVGNIIYGGQHLQIETGDTYSCKDYVQQNIKSAADWLQNNQEKLVGLTALRFSQQAKLFIANPTWTALNQRMLGKSYPAPPDPNSGDELDLVYQHVPGAFELLNRAQFLQAVAQVNTNPQHLDFYMGIYQPVPGQVIAAGNRWTKGYDQPLAAGNMYGSPSPGKGVYPDPVFSHGWKPFQPMLAANPGDSYSAPSPTSVTWGIGLTGAEADKAGLPFSAYSYTACPNLYTNNNTYAGTWPDGQGKIRGQTDICPGIYNLQVLYPTLTTQQCELIAQKICTAFNVVVSLLPTGGGGAPLPPDPDQHPAPPTPVFPAHMTSFGPDIAALSQSISTAQTGYAAFLAAHPALGQSQFLNKPVLSTLTVQAVAPPAKAKLSALSTLGLGGLTGGIAAVLGAGIGISAGVGIAGALGLYGLFGRTHAQAVTSTKLAAASQPSRSF